MNKKQKTCKGFWEEDGVPHEDYNNTKYLDVLKDKTFTAVPKSEHDKMMDSCHKLEVAHNELIQYSAKQCTDLVNSISKEKIKKAFDDEIIEMKKELKHLGVHRTGESLKSKIFILEHIEKELLGEK